MNCQGYIAKKKQLCAKLCAKVEHDRLLEITYFVDHASFMHGILIHTCMAKTSKEIEDFSEHKISTKNE